MKKTVKTLTALGCLAAACALTACDSKLCYCYEATASGVYEQEAYTNTDTPCNSLSNSRRTCVERNERMNPEDIAYK